MRSTYVLTCILYLGKQWELPQMFLKYCIKFLLIYIYMMSKVIIGNGKQSKVMKVKKANQNAKQDL